MLHPVSYAICPLVKAGPFQITAVEAINGAILVFARGSPSKADGNLTYRTASVNRIAMIDSETFAVNCEQLRLTNTRFEAHNMRYVNPFVRGRRPPRWLRFSSTVGGPRPVTRIVGKPAPVASEFDWIPSPYGDGFRFGV